MESATNNESVSEFVEDSRKHLRFSHLPISDGRLSIEFKSSLRGKLGNFQLQICEKKRTLIVRKLLE